MRTTYGVVLTGAAVVVRGGKIRPPCDCGLRNAFNSSRLSKYLKMVDMPYDHSKKVTKKYNIIVIMAMVTIIFINTPMYSHIQ